MSTCLKRAGKRGRIRALIDTNIFDEDRYFDIFVEYAKETPENILINIHGMEPRARSSYAACAPRRVWFLQR